MKTKELRGERGQAAVLITILLMFALIALTALAIDGGHLYVVRRDLQNMSDAACLAAATELSLQGTVDDAYNSAVEYILANGGAEDLYTPEDVGGGGLVKGIQVSGADVRVALQTFVDTYFTMIFNRSEAAVGARSHCNATAAGGLLPIAVRRFEYNEEDPTQQRDFLANKTSDPFHNPPGPGYGEPGLPRSCSVEEWPGRYGDMEICLPTTPYTVTDGLLDDPQTGTIDCDTPPRDDPPVYVGICALGDGVGTNDGTADYKGFVLLDVRNIVPGPVEYLHGATGQADTNKDISKQYFHTGYTGPNPMIGDQLAMLDGVSNDFAAQEMAEYFEVGDEFVAVVYSGNVWDVPDLEMRIEPVVNTTSPISDTVAYTLTLQKIGPKPWDGDANFLLQYSFMEQTGGYKVITPTVVGWPTTVPLLQGAPSVTATMTISATNPVTATYLSALTVRAEEITGVGLKRWASTNFRYEYPSTTLGPDFTLYAGTLEYDVPQGGSLSIPLTTRGFGFARGNVSVNAELLDPLLGWGDVFASSPSDKTKILDGKDNDSTFMLKVKRDAPTTCITSPISTCTPLTAYTVRLTVAPGGGVPSHSVDIAVNVYEPTPGGEPSRFVIVEGFAPFRVSYKDANTIGAYAIGPICDRAEDLVSGLNPRLLPW